MNAFLEMHLSIQNYAFYYINFQFIRCINSNFTHKIPTYFVDLKKKMGGGREREWQKRGKGRELPSTGLHPKCLQHSGVNES